MRKWILFGFIIFIAAFLRLWQLGNVPYGFLNDEVVSIYNAQSIWQTGGHIIDGEFLPLNIHGVGNDLTPVPVYIESVFLGLFGTSPFVGRLAYALAGIGSVVLLFFILDYLTHNDWISLGGAFAFAVSPWHLLVSRGAWESVVAIFFYLLGIYIFLRNIKKGSILWSLPAFLLAFYSYNAGKIFFVFFITGILFWYRKTLLQRKKELIAFILGVLLIVGSFVVVLKTGSYSRGDVLLWQSPAFSQQVFKNIQFQKQHSTAPNKLATIYSNKATEIGKSVLDTYLDFFSPYYLFLHGDTDMVNGYGIFFWGEMYLIELPFLLGGLLYISQKDKRQTMGILLIGLLAAPIASALTYENYTYNYLFRGNIAIPFLAALVGCGMYSMWELVRNKSRLLQYALLTIGVVFYLFFISRFLYTYYYQFTTIGGNFWLSSSRNVIDIVKSYEIKGKHAYIGTPDKEFLLQYAFFTKVSPKEIQEVWSKNSFTLGNVTFGDVCQILRGKDLPKNSVFVVPASCDNTGIPFQQLVRDNYSTSLVWQVYEN